MLNECIHTDHWLILLFHQRQGTGTSEHSSLGTVMNASIPSIPCNTDCNVSVSTNAWSTVCNNPISCNDETNQTFTSASIGEYSGMCYCGSHICIMCSLHLHCSPLSASCNQQLEKELQWKRCDAVCSREYFLLWGTELSPWCHPTYTLDIYYTVYCTSVIMVAPELNLSCIPVWGYFIVPMLINNVLLPMSCVQVDK